VGSLVSTPEIAHGTSSLPNGLVVRAKGHPEVYYIQNDKKHYVSSPRLLNTRFNNRALTLTSKTELDAIPQGAKVKYSDGTLMSHDDTVYVIANGKRRPIVSADVFQSKGYAWSNIISVSAPEINLHVQGKPLTKDSPLPDGSVIQGPENKMFLIDEGNRRYIPSPNIFRSRFDWSDVISVTQAKLDAFPRGNKVLFPPGLLLADSQGVFLSGNGTKRPIYSPTIFESYGFQWENIRFVSQAELDFLKTENALKSVKIYPTGTPIKDAQTNQKYVEVANGLSSLSTTPVLQAYGSSRAEQITLPHSVIEAYSHAGKALADFTPQDMVNAFTLDDFPRVTPITRPPYITGDAEADARIRAIATERGYTLQHRVTRGLVSQHEDRIQPQVKKAWQRLQADARQKEIDLSIFSGYRSIADQRRIFLSRLDVGGEHTISEIANGEADAAINNVLKTASIPGYSKHHSGYAIDITQENSSLKAFGNTEGFEWLSKNNYQNARKHGFVPSYPDGVQQGPRPEPWEYVWVGEQAVK